MAAATSLDDLIACPDCDLLHHRERLPPGHAARCARCDAVLSRRKINSVDRTLAFACASLVCFLLTNTFPFLEFELEGRVQSSGFLTGALGLARSGLWPLAALVFVTGFLAPLLHILGLLYLMLPLKLGHRPWKMPAVQLLLGRLGPWAMVEIFMLGAIVAIIKLSEMADVRFGVAFWAFTGLILCTAAASASLDRELVWTQRKVVR
jgi:paraquat-inducible protein A